MPSRRLSMRQLREILRLRLTAQLSMRQIKDSLRLSLGAVQKVISQADVLGLDWAAIAQQDDQQLARLFYPTSDTRVSSVFQLPNWVDVHQELKRKGVTKHLLWDDCMDAGGRATQEQLPENIPRPIPPAVTAIRNIVFCIRTG
jgi:hypothetical protein